MRPLHICSLIRAHTAVENAIKRFFLPSRKFGLRHPPAVVHVLPEKRDRRLRPIFLDEGHVYIVHEIDEALQARRPVRLATPLCAAKHVRNERGQPGTKISLRSV